MFFILWVNTLFLVSRWNLSYFTISSSCHAALWRAWLCWLCLPAELPHPQVIPVSEKRAVIASLQLLAVLQLAQPSMLLAFPAASHLTCPKQGAVWNWDWLFCPSDIQQHISFIMGSLLMEVRDITEAHGYYTEPRFQKAKGSEITHVKFLMRHFLKEVSDVIKILLLHIIGEG